MVIAVKHAAVLMCVYVCVCYHLIVVLLALLTGSELSHKPLSKLNSGVHVSFFLFRHDVHAV